MRVSNSEIVSSINKLKTREKISKLVNGFDCLDLCVCVKHGPDVS